MTKDNFSHRAEIYARFRPAYPKGLFDFILSHVENLNQAWDCGTGNGQAAKDLSLYFDKVFATDISSKQLENAIQATNIIYSVQPAEKTNFADHGFDLVTVSQALHWFQFDLFYKEVQRVARPGAWLAVWMYSLPTVSPAIDELILQHHTGTLGKYWDKERKYVDENYTTIPFPFPEIPVPEFKTELEWSITEMAGYLNTWSALRGFIAAIGFNPVDLLIKKLEPLWQKEKMKIEFPLKLRMGRLGN